MADVVREMLPLLIEILPVLLVGFTVALSVRIKLLLPSTKVLPLAKSIPPPFNVPVFKNGSDAYSEADYIEEHIAILNERWEEMNKPDAIFYTLEDVDKLLKNKVIH